MPIQKMTDKLLDVLIEHGRKHDWALPLQPLPEPQLPESFAPPDGHFSMQEIPHLYPMQEIPHPYNILGTVAEQKPPPPGATRHPAISAACLQLPTAADYMIGITRG